MSDIGVQQARAALQADPTQARRWVAYINALIQAGQLGEARKMLALAYNKGLDQALMAPLARILDKPEPTRTVFTQARQPSISAQAQHDQAARMRSQGQLREAEKHYRLALQADPGFVVAHYNLGNTLKELGQFAQAQSCYERALELDPQLFEARYNLANLLRGQGHAEQSIAHYHDALRLRPGFAPAHWNLGLALDSAGKKEEAEAHYRQTIASNPGHPDAHEKMAQILHQRGRHAESLASYDTAIALLPTHAGLHAQRGGILREMHRLADAKHSYQEALRLDASNVQVHQDLAGVCWEMGQLHDAESHYRRAIDLSPRLASAHFSLGVFFETLERPYEALPCFSNAIDLKHDWIDAYVSLSTALENIGRHSEATAVSRRAVSIDPLSRRAHSNLLFDLNYDPERSAEEIYSAYQAYEHYLGEPMRSHWMPHTNTSLIAAGASSHPRRLRIGYVSPDLRQHSVRHFLEPLLAHHDHTRIEVFAYAELAREDTVTERYRDYCDHFVLTRVMSDEDLAVRIRSDAIDVLIDLAGHTAGNRLLVFARKPAPVSLSWLGYGYTTGLKAIDYLLTDEASAPTGSEHLFSEAPWRLPGAAYVYRPEPSMGKVSELPALANGFVTFGTLTRAIRINHRTVRVWAEILKRVPGSRLVIDSKNFQHASMQEAMAERFAQHGIARERLLIGCHSPPWDTLRAMDIGLDCFPHNSGATLFETLYMGVPYVTLAGRPSVGLLGKSILTGLGKPEWLDTWCATNEEEYIDKAVALTSDLTVLQQVRQQLRGQMRRSALMDEAGFARMVEEGYAQMFARWQEMRT